MAPSHEMVAPALADINRIASVFADTSVIVETNKRVVFKCPNIHIANRLAARIGCIKHDTNVKRGLITDHGYVQAWL